MGSYFLIFNGLLWLSFIHSMDILHDTQEDSLQNFAYAYLGTMIFASCIIGYALWSIYWFPLTLFDKIGITISSVSSIIVLIIGATMREG